MRKTSRCFALIPSDAASDGIMWCGFPTEEIARAAEPKALAYVKVEAELGAQFNNKDSKSND